MRKIINMLLILIIGLSIITNISIIEPKAATSGEWEYELDFITSNIVITGYNGSEENIEIPSYLNEKPVIAIEANAFRENQNIKNVIIPNSVKKIGDGAFDLCYYLESIILPNSIKRIDDNTFRGCASLKSITIPETVTTIGENAFLLCESITEMNVPNSVVYIGDNAFSSCINLKKINLPDSLTLIENYMFSWCTSLKDINMPTSLKIIGEGAFEGCESLTDLSIPDSVIEIKPAAFSFSGITNIRLSNSLEKINTLTFGDCTNLKSIEIPNSVKNINAYSFKNCTSLEKIIIPSSVENIDYRAFEKGNKNLKIYGEKGSYAETYASKYKIAFYILGEDENVLNITLFSTDVSSQVSKSKVELKANAKGTGELQYKFIVTDNNGNWFKIRDFATANTCIWTTGSKGNKTLFVDVKDSSNTVIRRGLDFIVK